MKKHCHLILVWLATLACAAGADNLTEHILTEIKPLGLRFVAKLPASAKIYPDPSEPPLPTFCVDMTEEEAEIMIEARSAAGKILWSHEFGYNSSAINRVSVAVSSTSDAAIIHYQGYKFDHEHVFLLISAGTQADTLPKISVYDPSVLLQEIKKHAQYVKGTRYFIYPSAFENDLVKFTGIPHGRKDEPHPFSQEMTQWFTIEAKLEAGLMIRPLRVIPDELSPAKAK